MRNTTAAPATSNSASVVKISPGTLLLWNIGIENAANMVSGSGLPQPGSLATLYVNGVDISGTVSAPGLPLPLQLGGFKILVDGVAAPLVSVTGVSFGAQVNFQVPWELTSGGGTQFGSHMVEVDYDGAAAFMSPGFSGPGIFALPDVSGATQHASDYSLVTPDNPVHPGEIVVVYATGLGPVQSSLPSGAGANGPDPVDQRCNSITTDLGTILYAGLTPGFPGLYQLNIRVSASLQAGVNNFYIQANGCLPLGTYRSNAVYIYVSQ
jgi:uncharacterized protein (TIGR03437 family)